ncbi:PucR family transcriptional regulator [Mycolicibacterium sp.]|uniref:PucR family transcriptional regulator n=1 Tax=Mycolicibacterium sp. TaxID=2320850 RepID=UPI0037CB4804
MIGGNHETDTDGWLAVQGTFVAMADEVSTIAETVTQFIRSAQPAYALIPESEHRAAVELQMLNRLHALSEQRGLNVSELAAATDLAAERAADGVPIDALIGAYQAADTMIWRILVERSTPPMIALLPRIGTLMFEAIRETTTAMAGAHSRVARAIDGDRITLAHQFLECLEDPEQRSAASVIAARLRLDPAGEFVGLVWLPDPDVTELSAHRTVSTLPAHLDADVVSRSVTGGRLEMITQSGLLPEIVAGGSAGKSLAGRWGVGLVRSGLAGAGKSLGDARLALNCTSEQRPVRTFEDDWHEAVVLAERDRFDVVLAPAVGVAGAQPHLAETVLAFAAADMSIAATAQAVHVHANSVTYRLDRWSQLTGLRARSFAGLMQSVVACRLAGLDGMGDRRREHQKPAR